MCPCLRWTAPRTGNGLHAIVRSRVSHKRYEIQLDVGNQARERTFLQAIDIWTKFGSETLALACILRAYSQKIKETSWRLVERRSSYIVNHVKDFESEGKEIGNPP